MTIRKAGDTNVGRKRNHNEDNFMIVHDQLLYIVADGMGGHAAGEVASKMAVETVSQFFKDTAEDDEITWPFKMDRQKKYEENRLHVQNQVMEGVINVCNGVQLFHSELRQV